MKKVKQIKKVEIVKNVEIESLVNVIEDFLSEDVPELDLQVIRNLKTIEERRMAIEERNSYLESNAKVFVNKAKEDKYFLKGSHQLGRTIYINSLEWKETSVLDLWKKAKEIKSSLGKIVGLKNASFTRTFNTSLGEIVQNRKTNVALKEDEKRQIETIRYFDEINETLKDGTQKERFLNMFKEFSTEKLLEGIKVSFRTVPVPEDANIKATFGSQNMILVEEGSLPLFKTYLLFKGANTKKTKEVLNYSNEI